MLKFYILASKPDKLYRHFSEDYSNLNSSNAEVVINTMVQEHIQDLVFLCNSFGITYHITESNGTPGKGKNELLKIFLDSDNEYCVMVDGDDFLTPFGVSTYTDLASYINVPDVICLTKQRGIVMKGVPWEPMYRTELVFEAPEGEVDFTTTREKLLQANPDKELVDKYIEYHREFYRLQQTYCEGHDTHNRVVFLSRKAANYRFLEDMPIGEDTLHFYNLKNAHMNGNLVCVANIEQPATYVYDKQDPRDSSLYRETKGFQYWEWMDNFNKKVKDLEAAGVLHESPLPTLFFNYKEIPEMNDLNMTSPKKFSKNGVSISLPANTSPSSVDNLLFEFGIVDPT